MTTNWNNKLSCCAAERKKKDRERETTRHKIDLIVDFDQKRKRHKSMGKND